MGTHNLWGMLSLGITFPFNLIVGIPLYEAAAEIAMADDERVASAQPITSTSHMEEP